MAHYPLVLAGAGHAHLVALRQWRQQDYRPPPGSVLISSSRQAWYSGMMPGLLAGRFGAEQCSVDLLPWCDALGLNLLEENIVALNAGQRVLQLGSGGRLSYDVLSLNTGSCPPLPSSDGTVQVLPAKPFPLLAQAFYGWRNQAPLKRVLVVGGGAAGFELALALRYSLQCPVEMMCQSSLLASHPASLQQAARQLLQARGVTVRESVTVSHLLQGQAWQGEQRLGAADVAVVASGASPLHWYAGSGLAVSKEGFFEITPQLHSTSCPRTFATGDCAALTAAPRSGVYAVRQGPVLAGNLRETLTNESSPVLQTYRPQTRALALLATAEGGALASRGRMALTSRWLRPVIGRWKDHLDQGFIRRHSLTATRS